MVYLDHNATTPVDEAVLEAMLPFLKSFYGNPSGLYRLGRQARTAIDTAREQVAALAGVSATQVIFTSGGTEANNLALATVSPQARFAVSAIEHPSVMAPALRLRAYGHKLSIIAVDNNGCFRQDSIDDILAGQPEFVSMMLANNETGAIQAIRDIAPQFADRGISVHTDAVQAFAKMPLSFNELGVHMMTVSSHKIYGPKGCGALVVAKNRQINPVLIGGGQERGMRAGTENVAAIVGFGKAAELAQAALAGQAAYLLKLRLLLERHLKTIKGLVIFAEHAGRLPNTVQFGIDGVDGEMLLMQLDRKGIAVSSGSACASGDKKSSPVLAAMAVDEGLARSAIRISLGKSNTEADMLQFFNVLKTLLKQE